MEAAESLFEGDRGKALEWLNKPARALGGNPPATFLTTAVGAQAVIDLIGQIEHGVVV
jgi:putative toxin-antitoxin system antitoxin component (TIGR02293 family)